MTQPTITYRARYINDCTSTTGYTPSYTTLTLEAAAYVDCVAGDIGKQVRDDGADIGALAAYNNTTRIWWVNTASVVAAASAMTINGGVGSGTSRAGIISAARTFTSDGDVFTLGGTTGDTSAAEYFGEIFDIVDTQIYTDFYPKLTVRHKTSASTAGLMAYVVVTYTDTTTSTHSLGFSTTWTTTTVNLTASKTVDKIEFGAGESAANDANATYYVYYDFAMIHAGTLTWPYSPAQVEVSPPNRYADLEVWGRIGDITQYGGAKNTVITVSGVIDTNTAWHGFYGFDEEYFYRIMHELHPSQGYPLPWQWFTSDRFTGKVTPRTFRVWSSGEDNSVVNYEWVLHEQRTIGGENVDYSARFYNK